MPEERTPADEAWEIAASYNKDRAEALAARIRTYAADAVSDAVDVTNVLHAGQADHAVLMERERVQSVRDAAVNGGEAWDALMRMGPFKLTHAQAAQYDQISAAVGELFEALTSTKAEEICWSCEEVKICRRVMYATSPTDSTLKEHRWCYECASAHLHGLENEHDCGEGTDV